MMPSIHDPAKEATPMKRLIPTLLIGTAVLAVVTLAASRAFADDETEQTTVRIQAPLDAVDCTSQTISTLGLTIDIHTAAITGHGCGDDDGSDDDGDGTENDVEGPDSDSGEGEG